MHAIHRRRLSVVFATLTLLWGARLARGADDGDGAAAVRAYRAGNGLLNRGLYQLAEAEYRGFLDEHPDHEKAETARYGLGVCLYHQGRFDEAVPQLKQLSRERAFAFAAESATVLGQCRAATGDFAGAAADFAFVVQHFPGHDLADDAAAGWVEALYRSADHGAVVQQCEAFESTWPRSPLLARVRFFYGLALMAQHEHSRALPWFERVVRTDGLDEGLSDRATLMLAQCEHRVGRKQEASRHYEAAIDSGNDALVPDATLGLAMLLQSETRHNEARRHLDALLRDYGDSPVAPQARLQLGRTHFDDGHYDRALAAFRAVEDVEGIADAAAYWMAKCEIRRSNWSAAVGRLRRAIDDHPGSALLADMHYDYALAMYRAEDYAGAARALATLAARFPRRAAAAESLHLRALTEHQLDRFQASQEHCERFLAAHASHQLAASVRLLMGENEFLANRLPQAVDAYEQFLRRHSDDPRAAKAIYRLGLAHHRLDRPRDARPLLEKVTRGEDTAVEFFPALLALGDIAFRAGQWQRVQEHLTAFLSRGTGADVGGADDALLKLGLALARQGRHEEALRRYEELIADHPQSAHVTQAEFERGQSLLALGQLADAQASLERVLHRDDGARFVSFAHKHLGTIALQRRQFDAAAARFEQALDDEAADSAAISLQRGQALLAAGRFADAEATFRRFLEDNGRHEEANVARAQLALSIARQDHHAECPSAIDAVRLGRLRADLRASLLYEKAWCLQALDRMDEAAKAYRQIVEEEPVTATTAHAMLELAAIEMEDNGHQSAVELLDGLLAALRDGQLEVPASLRDQAQYRRGVCHYELGHFEVAAEQFEVCLVEFPASGSAASARFLCGESWVKLDRHDRAVGHFEQIVERFSSDAAFAAALLRLGESQGHLRRWAESERRLTEYLERFGDSEHWFRAQFGVGWARENQRRYNEAIDAYRVLVDRHQGPTAARAQFQIGECRFAQGQYEKAAAELLKVDILYAYPEWSAAALYEAGRCFERMSKPVEARRQFNAVTQRYGDTQWATLASQRLAELTEGILPGR